MPDDQRHARARAGARASAPRPRACRRSASRRTRGGPRSAQASACSACVVVGRDEHHALDVRDARSRPRASAPPRSRRSANAARARSSRLKQVTTRRPGALARAAAIRGAHIPVPMSATPRHDELLAQPVGHQRAGLVRHVVADVVAVLVEHPLAVREPRRRSASCLSQGIRRSSLPVTTRPAARCARRRRSGRARAALARASSVVAAPLWCCERLARQRRQVVPVRAHVDGPLIAATALMRGSNAAARGA